MRKNFYIAILSALILCLCVLCCAHAAISQVLVLPESTKAIETEAFYGDTSIREVVLPEGVETIGERAFANSGVTKVNLPETLTYIAPDAFAGCDGVTVIVVAGTPGEEFAKTAGVEYEYVRQETPAEFFTYEIENGECTITGYTGTDTDVVIPDVIEGCRVTGIGESAFDGNSAVISVDIPDTVVTINAYAFCDCTSLSSIDIPSGVTVLSEGTFYGCTNLTSISLPDGLTHISSTAFLRCASLTSIDLPSSLTQIDDFAFYDCTGLTSITIPEKITIIDEYTFSDCTSLISIDLPQNLEQIGKSAFRDCSKLDDIDFPKGLTTIGEYAFMRCASLSDISIPGNVTYIGGHCFAECDNLKTVTIEYGISTIESYAFGYCRKLESVSIPSSVTTIKDKAFVNCSSLSSITIPNSVTSIGELAFALCSFSSITIPDSVIDVGNAAFAYNEKLTSVKLPNGITSIPPILFDGCSSLTSFTVPDGVTNIGYQAFNNCTSLTSISLPNSLTSIEKLAFSGCTSLTSISLPNSLTSLGEYMTFASCSSLTSITIPDRITVIPDTTFARCTNLTEVIIPDSVTNINIGAFIGCSSLQTIKLPDGLSTLANDVFMECTSLTHITIPSGISGIYNNTFKDCTNLASVTIPDSVSWVSTSAFENCTSLTSISLPKVRQFYGDAFTGCTNLTSIYISSRAYDFHVGDLVNSCPNLTIYGEAGSDAETFASDNGIPFIPGPIPSPGPDDNTTITLSGYVQNASGAPIESVYVSVITPADDSFGELTMTNRNGYWSVSGLPAGNDYTVIFSHADYDFGDPITNPQEDDAPVVGQIKTSGTSDVSFTMQYEPTTAVDADILVGDSVSFVVTANDATKIRLVVDGALYNEYPVKNGQAVFSRTFTMSGQRSIAFQAYDGENWGKICTAQTLVIGEYGKLTAPVVHSIDTQYVDQPFTLSWNPVENAQSYTVYLYKDSLVWPTRSNTDVSTTQDCSIQIPGDALYITGDYQIEVIAAGYGYSQATGKASFTVEATNAGMEITYPRNGATYDVGDTMHTQYVTSTGVKSVRLLVTPPSGSSNATLLAPGSDDVFYPVAEEVGTYTLTPYYSTSADGFENIADATAGESITVKVAAPAIESLIQGPNKSYAVGYTNTAFDFTGTLSNSRYSVSVACNGEEVGTYSPNQNGKFTYTVAGLASDGKYDFVFTPSYGNIKGKSVSFPVYEVEKADTEINKFAAGTIDILSHPDSPDSLAVPYGSAVTVLGRYDDTHLYVSINGNNYFVLADCALADAVEIADITIDVACLREDDLPYSELNTIRQYRVSANGAVSVSATVTTPSEKMTCTAIKKDSDFLIYIPVEEAGGYSCIFTVVDAAGLSKDTNAYVFAGVDTSYKYAGQECWSHRDQYLDTIGYEEGYSNVDQIDAAVSRMFCIGLYSDDAVYVRWQVGDDESNDYAIVALINDNDEQMIQFDKNTTMYRLCYIANTLDHNETFTSDRAEITLQHVRSLYRLLPADRSILFYVEAQPFYEIWITLGTLFSECDYNDIVYVYWFGHGLSKADDLNIPAYSWGINPITNDKYSGFEYEVFCTTMAKCRGKVNLIIDTCFSGDFVTTLEEYISEKEFLNPNGIAVLMATAKGEPGLSDSDKGARFTAMLKDYIYSMHPSGNGLTLFEIKENVDVGKYPVGLFESYDPTTTYWGDPNRVFFAEDPDAVK